MFLNHRVGMKRMENKKMMMMTVKKPMESIKLFFKKEEVDNFSYVYFLSFRDTDRSTFILNREVCFKY